MVRGKKSVSDDKVISLNKHIIYTYQIFLEAKKNAYKSIELGLNARQPNFPSEISEYIAKRILIKKWELEKNDIVCGKCGDLCISKTPEKKIEVKCFSSNGPISFGPKESWHYLVLIDARECMKKIFTVYLVNHKNDSKIIKNLKVNKSETFADQCKNKRRPRIRPDDLIEQLGEKIKLLAIGTINKLIA